MLLLALLVICALLAVWTNRARRQEALVRKVVSLGGGYVTYAHEIDASGKVAVSPVPPGPAWLRRWLGDQAFFQLRSIGSNGLEDDDLARLAEFSTIERLQLGDRISDAGLTHLERLCNLKWLECESPFVTDHGLRSLAELNRLEFLAIPHALVTDEGLKHLAALKNLEYVNLDRTQVTDAGAAWLRTQLPTARIDPGNFASDDAERETVQELIRHGIRFRAVNGSIEQIDLKGSNFTDDDLPLLSGLAHLKSLFLLDTRVTSAGIERLRASHPGLRVEPDFRAPVAEEVQTVDALQQLGARLSYDGEGRVRVIELTSDRVHNADLAPLAGLSHLQSISIFSSWITEDGLRRIAECHSLEKLILVRAKITNAGLLHLRGLANLRKLSARGEAIDDQGLAALEGMLHLSRLSLNHTRITGHGLPRLASLKDLEELSLAGSPIDDAGLALLPHWSQLKRLTLASTAVTDSGLASLGRLESLERLTLTGTAITDAGLLTLSELPALKYLNVEHTRVTRPGVAEFIRLRPTCKARQ